MSDAAESKSKNPEDSCGTAGHEGEHASADAVIAADGTDLTVIRWMLAMSPEDRLRWLQTHMRAVASIRRDRDRP